MSTGTKKRSPSSSQLVTSKIARLKGENEDEGFNIGADEKKTPVYKSLAVLGEVPIRFREDYLAFDMFSESDAFAAVSGQATQSILDSIFNHCTMSLPILLLE